ncbi:MAG TPA: pseudouridine synthase [Desulfomicrobiaceae bacterium]|nr:pseudouridine synthase [Desulfomicrobiaceae bacterium]
MIPVLFEDDHFIAAHKPPGMLVHRTERAPDSDVLLQRLRDQVGHRIFPVHRLDRPASGAIIFGRTSEAAAALCRSFQLGRVHKTYLAVVRGWPDRQGVIDSPLARDKEGGKQEAVTKFKRLRTAELPFSTGRYPSSRYALVRVRPRTGRFHQIRRHFAHLRHPLVGDVLHGDGRHNRLYRDRFNLYRLLLMAVGLGFTHPFTDKQVHVAAPLDEEVRRVLKRVFG